MSQIADYMIDRKRMRRKLTFWRVVAFGVAAIALASLFSFSARQAGVGGADKAMFGLSDPHVARIEIKGMILENRYALQQLDKIAKSSAVKALIVNIDSPGGTTTGGEALHNAILKIAEKKPVVTTVSTLAASAGYMVAIASDHIVSRRSSIVGSVGVIMQYPDATALLDKMGVKMNEIKSSPIKAEPSPFNATPPQAEVMLQAMIDDSYGWFANMVKERRGFSDEQAKPLLDGSVFTGSQALEHGLVDALGGEEVARAWLEDEKSIDANWKTRDWTLVKPVKDDLLGLLSLAKKAINMLGLSAFVNVATPSLTSQDTLDGMLSVWQG